MKSIFFALLFTIFTAPMAFADDHAATPEKKEGAAHYTFDKAHTQILFFVNHLGFSMSQGEFLDYEGGFTFDPATPRKLKH